MQMQSIADLMENGMTYVLDFERQIAQAAPRMVEAATNPELKELFSKTATKSQEYARRIESALEKLGKTPRMNENHIAKAMLTEVEHMISETQAGAVRDAALIVAANQQQSYRVASYGSLETYAKLIGNPDAAKGLDESLEDAKGGDERFTQLAESKVNPEARNTF